MRLTYMRFLWDSRLKIPNLESSGSVIVFDLRDLQFCVGQIA